VKVTINVTGDILRDLQDLGEAARPAAKAVFQRFVDRVVPMARSLTPDDPHTSGNDLKASVRGRVTLTRKGMVVASVMAGGSPLLPLLSLHRRNPENALWYAFVQHEDPTLRHASGQANYIGQPFMALAGSVGEDLDKEIASRAR
jgi:hypothetical protein